MSHPEAPNQFCTAVTCMDGRIQESVASFLREHFQAQWVDTVTEAGPVGALADGVSTTMESVNYRVGISINAHASVGIGVVAHESCAAVAGGQPEQAPLALDSAQRLREQFPGVEVIALWAQLDGTITLLS